MVFTKSDSVNQNLNNFRQMLRSFRPSEFSVNLWKKHGNQCVDVDYLNKMIELNERVLVDLENRNQWDSIEIILNALFYNTTNLELDTRRQFAYAIIELSKVQPIDKVFREAIAEAKIINAPPINQSQVADKSQTLLDSLKKEPSLSDILNLTMQAGFTLEQALKINETYALSQIRVIEERDKKCYQEQIKILSESKKSELALSTSDSSEILDDNYLSIPDNANSTVDVNYIELQESFKVEYSLVKVIRDGEPKIYSWDNRTKRYILFETNVIIKSTLNSYAYVKYGQHIDLSSTKLDSIVNRMIYDNANVPLLGESEKVQLGTNMQVFFRNGYLDLEYRESKIYSYTLDTRQYFHVFCLPYDFPNIFKAPIHFDKLLRFIFDDDKTKITLVYEIIGAIISNVPLKNIFVFQGKSHRGKSVLADLIMRLLIEEEIKDVGSINEINETKSKPYEGKIKLLYIDDAPNEKWSNATVSYLKTRSRGISRQYWLNFKILLSTNYPIYFKTEDGRDESMENRIIVVPFEKNLEEAIKKNSDMGELIDSLLNGNVFEAEKNHVVLKALYYFRAMLDRNREFIDRYPLNKSVITSSSDDLILSEKANGLELKDYAKTSEDKQTISDKNPKLMEWLRDNFELTDNEEEYMLAEQVFNCIKQAMPETNGRVHDVGKPIKMVFGEDIKTRRNAKTYYKIKLKAQEQ